MHQHVPHRRDRRLVVRRTGDLTWPESGTPSSRLPDSASENRFDSRLSASSVRRATPPSGAFRSASASARRKVALECGECRHRGVSIRGGARLASPAGGAYGCAAPPRRTTSSITSRISRTTSATSRPTVSTRISGVSGASYGLDIPVICSISPFLALA